LKVHPLAGSASAASASSFQIDAVDDPGSLPKPPQTQKQGGEEKAVTSKLLNRTINLQQPAKNRVLLIDPGRATFQYFRKKKAEQPSSLLRPFDFIPLLL
jgi:hypothetical protein